MSDPKIIWLGPACESDTGDGRTWAEESDTWHSCDCGHAPIRYNLGEDFDRVTAERDAALGRVTELETALRKIKLRLDAYAEADMRMPEPSVEVCQAIADAALNPSEGGGDEYRKSCEAAHKALSMENQRIIAPGQFKCLACGDIHSGSGNLPCPKMSPTA